MPPSAAAVMVPVAVPIMTPMIAVAAAVVVLVIVASVEPHAGGRGRCDDDECENYKRAFHDSSST
jgi:hypothetical protein